MESNVTLTFTKEEASNLLIFLQRTQITGAEVPAYVAITNKIVEARDTKRSE